MKLERRDKSINSGDSEIKSGKKSERNVTEKSDMIENDMSISMERNRNKNRENKNKNFENGKIKMNNISNNRPSFRQISGSDEKVLSVVKWWERKGKALSNVTVMPSGQSAAVLDLLGGGKVELRRDETRDN